MDINVFANNVYALKKNPSSQEGPNTPKNRR